MAEIGDVSTARHRILWEGISGLTPSRQIRTVYQPSISRRHGTSERSSDALGVRVGMLDDVIGSRMTGRTTSDVRRSFLVDLSTNNDNQHRGFKEHGHQGMHVYPNVTARVD